MSDRDEFDGDACVVLPKDYLNSPAAVAEIYEAELAQAAARNFDVDQLRRRPRLFKGSIFIALIWALPSTWPVCL